MKETLKINSHVRSMVGDDGAVLLDLKGGKYYSLNIVGATIWNKAQEGYTLAGILEHLKSEFSAPPAQLHEDLTTFVKGLEKKGLVHVHE